MTREEGQQELEQYEQQIKEYSSFAEEVWRTLSSINVNDFTEKKGKLTYLSWANAWAALMEVFPESQYERTEDEYFTDGTMSVGMKITVQRENQKPN